MKRRSSDDPKYNEPDCKITSELTNSSVTTSNKVFNVDNSESAVMTEYTNKEPDYKITSEPNDSGVTTSNNRGCTPLFPVSKLGVNSLISFLKLRF